MKLQLQHLPRLGFFILTFFAFHTATWAQSELQLKTQNIGGNTLDDKNTDPLAVTAKITPVEWNEGQNGSIEMKLHLPNGFHAYADKFKLTILEPDGFKMAALKITPLSTWYDHFSKKNRSGIKGDATLRVQIEAPDHFIKKQDSMKLELSYQACSEQFCLFPVTKTINIPIVINGYPEATSELISNGEKAGSPTGSPWSQYFDSNNFKKYLSTNLFFGFIFIFFAGIFTSFTPCIFPMIPITLAVLGNHAEEKTRLQNFITSLSYVLGIATTYSTLGVIAASGGQVFGASLGSPIVLSIVCSIFLLMALSMYGLFDLQLPAFIHNHLSNKKHGQGLGKVYLTGMFAGIVASPCVGPVLVAILTYVASTQNKLLGFFFLFTYALGFGLIFIALGFSNQFAKALPRSGSWMIGIKFILGTLMLSAFYYYLELLLPNRGFDFFLGLGLVILASSSGAFLSIKNLRSNQSVQKGLMQALLIVGIGYICLSVFDLRPYIQGRIMADNSLNKIQELNWQPYSQKIIEQAKIEKRPLIIDFWAEWCAACHELEEHTFTDPRVRSIAQGYTLLKFDATRDSVELRTLKKKYKIQGLPTLIFVNKDGVWIDALTLTQFEKSSEFLIRLEKGLH
jgi:thiol:disulfide interchange protein DsbD